MDQLPRKNGTRLFDELPPSEVEQGLPKFSGSSREETATLGTPAHHDVRVIGDRNDVEASDEVLLRRPFDVGTPEVREHAMPELATGV